MYFMSTECGRPQGGGGREGGPAHVDACGQGEGDQKRDFFVDVINGWPLRLYGPSKPSLLTLNLG